MAVVVTVVKGYDLGYIWKTQDRAAERVVGGYHLHAAQAGEPPGRWWGPGARALGFSPGQTVERQPYDAVYRQADPRTGAKLGRPRGLGGIRAAAEADAARKAGDHDRAARHEQLAVSYHALRDHYQQQEQTLAQAMADRQEWEFATGGSRQLAIAADAELRRRHPGQQIEPLRSAEPAPVSDAERHHPDLIPHQRSSQTAQNRDVEEQRQSFRAGKNERRRLAPGEDAAWGGSGEASPVLPPPWRDAILQPPKPQIIPSAEILQLAAEHDIEPEAGG